MSPDQQINHLEVLDAALTTVATECSVLSLGPDTTEAIATLTKAAADAKVALVERILAWLDGNCDAPEARSALTTARAMLADIRYGADVATAAELRRQGRLQ
jgi:hypothetical protein